MVGTAVEAGGENLRRLKNLLGELFMFDQADLDFGIYRIMKVRREEIRRFLDDDLLVQVREALGDVAAGERAAIERELREAEAGARMLGMNPDDTPRVRELREQHHAQPDIAAAEEEVYSHLVTFFRRYYKEGDFISQRRYKEGVYAIPYEGEEVKLHWANADQYYVKSAEHFRDYTFLLADGRRVHFKLVEASTETNNNRAQNGNDRRFILANEAPVAEQDGELVVRFEYRPDMDGRERDEVNAESVERILNDPAAAAWQAGLGRHVWPDGAKEMLSVLRKHLNTYTARNEFDYFIHKDLGGFLRRELDFYVKNEVMHLDDIDQDGKSAPDIERYLYKLRAIRRVGHKIIDFLGQLEDFQKRLWLKKKFVVETHWCVTLDRVPEELYEEIAANDRQREEWVRLFAIDEMAGYSTPLSGDFLRANLYLIVDTSIFEDAFTERLLASIDDLDQSTDGCLIHSENYQALQLLHDRYAGSLRAIYLDPPYNTDAGPIAYKNGYRSASWMSLMQDRLVPSRRLLADDGILCVTIDDYQVHELAALLDQAFGREHHLGTIAIRNNPSGRSTVSGFSVSHEYAFFYRNSEAATVARLPRSEAQFRRFTVEEGQHVNWRNFRKDGGAVTYRTARPRQFYPIYADLQTGSVRVPSMTWNAASKAWETNEEVAAEETVIWPIDERGRERVWSLGHESARTSVADLRARVGRDGQPQVDRRHIPSRGVLPRTWWDKKTYAAREYGSAALSSMFGEGSVFSFAKSPFATQDCLWVSGLDSGDGVALDYFGGSGTTAHAIINLNREDDGQRKYVLVEMGEYFDTVMKPRVLKAVYSRDWRDGKPISREGVSQLVKVIRLESYEDTLNNLEVRRTSQQQSLLDDHDGLREEYVLRYWLDVETRGSASLLDIGRFDDPWSYVLNVARGSAAETRPVTVDLVETFNYLIGLRVRHVDAIRGVTMVQGTLPSAEKALIIWRKVADMPSEELDRFLFSQRINPRDMEFDVIYVNGDNHLENTRRPDETWKVRLIEGEFLRLMFETADRRDHARPL